MKYSGDLFNQNTVTNDDFIFFGKIFAGIVLSVFIIGKLTLKSPKQLAWVIGLMNATIMTILSTAYLAVKAKDIIPLVTSLKSADSLYHAKNDFCSLLALWFGVANTLDLILGTIFYPKYVQLLSGWIHHTVYIWMMYFSVTGNGGFVTSRPFAPAFVFAGIEELPTFILALGSIDSKYRSDLGFGLTFFTLRIAYHICIFGYCIYSKCDTVAIVLYTLTLILHLFWFITWVSKYAKPSKKGEKKN